MSDRPAGGNGRAHEGRAAHLVARSVGSPLLFSILYTVLAGAIYFVLGVVAGYALGLTPLVFVFAGLLYLLAAMTYMEGVTLFGEGGVTAFARHAFDELWSFIGGWAVMLDYVILIAATVFSATSYMQVFWEPLGEGTVELFVIAGILLYVAGRNVYGFSSARPRRIGVLVLADVALQVLLVALGMALLFDPGLLVSQVDLGRVPTVGNFIVALGIATVVATGFESAAGVAGEVNVSPGNVRRLVSGSSLIVMLIYGGIAVVALSAQPVVNGRTALSSTYEETPLIGIAEAFNEAWMRDLFKYLIAAVAIFTLIAASNSAMLGFSRLSYSLSTNRQIPRFLGRLEPRRFTPWVLIALASLAAGALAFTRDLEFLLGLYAFGALIGLTLAHVSIVRLRVRSPGLPRPYAVPLSVRVGKASIPIPAVVGALFTAAVWVSVVVTHPGARLVGTLWMVGGIAFYVAYRRLTSKPILRRVSVPREALMKEPEEIEYGTILVPVTGTPLDDDIMQTAGRLASEEGAEGDSSEPSQIEAVWFFEVPMSLPIDARLPDAETGRAREALDHAKRVGEEYEGVMVATAKMRTRSAGEGIVAEARRRGVQAIVLAAEEPSRIGGGARLGGSPSERFVGPTTRYVLANAHCPVILTAPARGERPVSSGTGD